MKARILLGILIASVLAGCGEKVNTDIKGVNEGKGESVAVEPRNRDGEAGGGR